VYNSGCFIGYPFSQIYNEILVLQNIKLATTQALKEKAGAVIHRFETRTLLAIEEMATKQDRRSSRRQQSMVWSYQITLTSNSLQKLHTLVCIPSSHPDEEQRSLLG